MAAGPAMKLTSRSTMAKTTCWAISSTRKWQRVNEGAAYLHLSHDAADGNFQAASDRPC